MVLDGIRLFLMIERIQLINAALKDTLKDPSHKSKFDSYSFTEDDLGILSETINIIDCFNFATKQLSSQSILKSLLFCFNEHNSRKSRIRF